MNPMKKILLLFLTLLLYIGVKANEDSGTLTDGTLTYGYCSEYFMGISTSTNRTELKAAIELPQSLIETWGNTKLIRVRVGIGTNSLKNATLYISETLGGPAVYQQNFEIETKDGWNEITLDQPYDFKGKGAFIGYMITTGSKNDQPIGVDNIVTKSTLGDNVCVNGKWQHVGEDFGNVCIQAVLSGGNLPKNDLQLVSASLPRVVSPDVPFTAILKVINNGVDKVTSVDVECFYNNIKLNYESIVLPEGGILSGKEGEIKVEGLLYREDSALDLPMSMTITQVNGQEDPTPDNNTINLIISCMEAGFNKSIIVEEWTGTWCGWCPRGIVGLSQMTKEYGDFGFIGIAVHDRDVMQNTKYMNFLSIYANGYPGCVVNRDMVLDPMKSNLLKYYKDHISEAVYTGIEVEAEEPAEGSKTIPVSAKIKFLIPHENIDYRVAFVLLEDHVGPYVQTNYYAGGGSGIMGGWESYPDSYYTHFDHVARDTWSIEGKADVLPKNPELKTEYLVEATLSANEVKDISYCTVVAIVIDAKTNKVVNAAKYEFPRNEEPASPDPDDNQGDNPEDNPNDTPDDNPTDNIDNHFDDILTAIPFDNEIIIVGDFNKCDVYDISGKIIDTLKHPRSVKVNSGIYFVVATNSDGMTVTKKIIVR